ncbi:MAG: rod-binding protein [Candidatus Rokubacteria bacterium]|nr:rod-binding protein [Candidatus Rokubacteria bacterium]
MDPLAPPATVKPFVAPEVLRPLAPPALRLLTEADRGRNTPDQIKGAAEQFEAIFLRQIVKGLRKTTELNGEPVYTTGFYGDLMDEQLAQHLAKAGGMGLAPVIRAYLEQHPR